MTDRILHVCRHLCPGRFVHAGGRSSPSDAAGGGPGQADHAAQPARHRHDDLQPQAARAVRRQVSAQLRPDVRRGRPERQGRLGAHGQRRHQLEAGRGAGRDRRGRDQEHRHVRGQAQAARGNVRDDAGPLHGRRAVPGRRHRLDDLRARRLRLRQHALAQDHPVHRRLGQGQRHAGRQAAV